MRSNEEAVSLTSTLKCPHCNTKREEKMPVTYCQIFYECTHCKAKLKPKQGDCCVFCSYGSRPCPPKQGESDEASQGMNGVKR